MHVVLVHVENFRVRNRVIKAIKKNVIGRRTRDNLNFVDPTTSFPYILTLDALRHFILYFSEAHAMYSIVGAKRINPGKV